MRYILASFYLALAGISLAPSNLAGFGVRAVDFALVRNFTLSERVRSATLFVNSSLFNGSAEIAAPGRLAS